MDKITLDMDFGDDTEGTLEDIEIPVKKTEDEKMEYVLELIQDGLGICEDTAGKIAKVKEIVEKFKGFGIDSGIISVLDYLNSIFERNIPELLRGHYDELIPKELELITSEEEATLLKDMLKSSRKELIKMLDEERKNK